MRHLRQITAALPSSSLRRSTYLMLWLLAFTVPWQRLVLLPGVGTITRLIGLAAAGLAALAVASEGRRVRLVDGHVLMILLTCWVVASAVWTIRPEQTYATAFTVVQLLAMAWMVTEFADVPARVRGIMWAYVLGATVTALIMIVQAQQTTANVARFSASENAHPNDIAFMLCLAVPMAWYLGFRARKAYVTSALWLSLPVMMLAVLLTASRSALLLMVVALTIIPLTWTRVPRSVRGVCIVVAAAALPLIVSVLPERPVERLTTIGQGLSDQTFGARRILMGAAWDIVGERPLAGVGAGASRYRIETLSGMQLGAHNAYLSVFSELGVVGLGIFTLLLLSIALRVLWMRGLERQLAMVLGATLLLGLLPRHSEYDKAPWLVMAVLLALSLAHERKADAVVLDDPVGEPSGASLPDLRTPQLATNRSLDGT